MNSKKILGVIFANVHDEFVLNLTKNRSMASIPFGGRYRMIDFTLSSLVNGGVATVGVVPKYNYHSLMNHLGSGKPWDLDRKNGGLFILPPYLNSGMSAKSGHIASLDAIMTYLTRSDEEYIILCDCDVVANVDVKAMLKQHQQTKADITIAYKKGNLPFNNGDVMTFDIGEDFKINKIRVPKQARKEVNFSLDTIIMKRSLLIKLVTQRIEKNSEHIWRDVFMPRVNSLNFCGFEVSSPVFMIDSELTYAKANFALLNPQIRNSLFLKDRPVYTKVRDDVPAKYGPFSKVSNSLVADGCIIEGAVSNSVLFRGVKVEKGAVIKNSIIMQDTVVGENCDINYVISDKNVHFGKETQLKGAATHYMYINKSAVL